MWRSAIIFLVCQLAASAAQKAVVIIDTTARNYLGTQLDDWAYQVKRETNFVVRIVETDRWTGDYTNNNWTSINSISNIITRETPDALLLIGRLPFVKIGAFAPDGHNLRAAASRAIFGCTNYTLPDTTSWGLAGTTVMESNVPSDGIPDTLVASFSFPVGVIDFSGMTTNSNVGTFASGYYSGQGACRVVDERNALKLYFTNNLAYRRKQWTNSWTGLLYSPIANSSSVSASNTVVTWTTTVAQTNISGGNWKFVWEQLTLPDFSPNYVTDAGSWVRAFWIVSTKSYNWEGYEGKGAESGVKYPQRHLIPGLDNATPCLVYSWSKSTFGVTPTWTIKSTDVTVADAMRSSAASQGGVVTLDIFNVWGDLTLQIPQYTQQAPGASRVGTLSVRTSQ